MSFRVLTWGGVRLYFTCVIVKYRQNNNVQGETNNF